VLNNILQPTETVLKQQLSRISEMKVDLHLPVGFKPYLTPEEYGAMINLSPRTVKAKALAGNPNFPSMPRKSDNEPVRINYMKIMVDAASAKY